MDWHDKWGGRNTTGMQLLSIVALIVLLEIRGCYAVNSEGLALLEFRSRIDSDPYGAFSNWKFDDHDPCRWSGVRCLEGQVNMLDLSGRSLKGALAPELGNLAHLKYLVLSKNQFSGAIPKQLGRLTMLELLDLSDNNLSGTIPAEIGELQSLKRLLLSNNSFYGSIPSAIWKLSLLEFQFDENHTSAVAGGITCVNRKFGDCVWQNDLDPVKRAEFSSPLSGTLTRCLNLLPFFNSGKGSFHNNTDDHSNSLSRSIKVHLIRPVGNIANTIRRRLSEWSYNLAAVPINGDHVIALPSSRSSGSFPALPKEKKEPSPPPPSPLPQQGPGEVEPPTDEKDSSGNTWKYIVGFSVGGFLLLVVVAMLIIFRSKAAKTIGPWKTGLSGQLQKAFVTGVPKLDRVELETACEDFSNIIFSNDTYILYKGTLSSGVEIAVASTTITSLQDWTKRAETIYRKKIDTLSRVNHKNFTNLIGYCEEDEPFVRMMVFEYAPNGTLFEHLHVKEVEHLDWHARMRIIMGTAYCIQYMHGLNPPVPHTNLISNAIFLTDDYAAKVAELGFWLEFITSSKNSTDSDSEHSELPPPADAETNAYSFGLLLLEIISGKLPQSEEQEPFLNWAAQFLNAKRSCLIDPTLKSFKDTELDIVCEVIQECVQPDARKRPTMEEIVSKLREVLDISPDAATPRLSPLWWAELEILSAEAP